MEYAELFGRLTFETAAITFLKKDGTIRHMLCTRNLHTVQMLHGWQGNSFGGHDKHCSITNGNIAVFDLILGESRSFAVSRLVSVEFCGEVREIETYNKILAEFEKYKELYEKNHIKEDDLNIDIVSLMTQDTQNTSNKDATTAEDVNNMF